MLNPDIDFDHEYNGIEVVRLSTPALVWLVERYGPAGKRWFVMNNTIYFHSDKDRLMFELKWCEYE